MLQDMSCYISCSILCKKAIHPNVSGARLVSRVLSDPDCKDGTEAAPKGLVAFRLQYLQWVLAEALLGLESANSPKNVRHGMGTLPTFRGRTTEYCPGEGNYRRLLRACQTNGIPVMTPKDPSCKILAILRQ